MAKSTSVRRDSTTRVAERRRSQLSTGKRASKSDPDVSGSKQRKKRYDAAHAKGMTALHMRDYEALEEAILEERKIIQEQASALKAVSTPKPARRSKARAKRKG